MARIDRIVKRRNLKEEVERLRTVARVTKPLIEAEQRLRQAFQAGYKARLQEEIEESKAQQEANKPHEATPVLNN